MIGGHRVFGHSMLWASVLTLVTPCAAFIDYKALVFVRALLGLMLGERQFNSTPFHSIQCIHLSIYIIERFLLLIPLSFVCSLF